MDQRSVSRFLSRLKTSTGVVSTIAMLLVGTMFCQLGLWQLSRADEKTAIVTAHAAAGELPPLNNLQGDVEKVLYRRVELSGAFDPARQFLLDNRIRAGQAGFEVIAPFFLNDDQYVLANLGWTGHNGDRKVSLTTSEILQQAVMLEGVLVAPSKGFVLGDSISESAESWPAIIQYIDYETIAAKLDKIPVIDAIVVAADGHAGGYAYNFKPVASGARKHLGYAFQWFAMLFALIVLYVYLMFFKKVDDPANE